MLTIALYNLKGGVGKTTSAVNLAYLAAEAKKNTVLWDWDPQGAASWYLQDEGAPSLEADQWLKKKQPLGAFEQPTRYSRLSLIPADLSLRDMDVILADRESPKKFLRKTLAPLGEHASVVILDCPPTLSPAMEHLLAAVDVVLVPIIPSPLSVRAASQVVEFFATKKKAPKKIVGFFNMADGRRKIHRETLAMAKNLPFPVLRTCIPADAAAEAMALRRAPLTSYAQRGRAALAYRKLWRDILRARK